MNFTVPNSIVTNVATVVAQVTSAARVSASDLAAINTVAMQAYQGLASGSTDGARIAAATTAAQAKVALVRVDNPTT